MRGLMTVIRPRRVRTSRRVAALLLCVVAARFGVSTSGQSITPFGSLFNSGHTPENPTADDIMRALTQMKDVAGHGSYMYEWNAG